MPTSNHADLLTALNEMQQSVAYAARRNVLAQAERIITQQEREIEGLRADLDHRTEMANSVWHVINTRRGFLIDLKLKGAATPSELEELARLQEYADNYVQIVAPRPDPIEMLRKSGVPESVLTELEEGNQ